MVVYIYSRGSGPADLLFALFTSHLTGQSLWLSFVRYLFECVRVYSRGSGPADLLFALFTSHLTV